MTAYVFEENEIEGLYNKEGEEIIVFVKDEEGELHEVETPLELAEEENNPILPAVNEIFWFTTAFAILFVLLLWKGVPVIRTAMKARTDKIQSDMDAAETARQDALVEKEKYIASLGDARSEANAIIDEARGQAEALKADRASALDTELAERRGAAMADIEHAKAQATADLQAQITQIALGAAETVVEHSLDNETNTRLIESYISQVASSN
ncbi:MAG: F0F1 ATP synthase subunit B [Acidimicrobiales bacterium]